MSEGANGESVDCRSTSRLAGTGEARAGAFLLHEAKRDHAIVIISFRKRSCN